ncbi:MAG: D-alanyl-D-alanine carboxypeptidase [Balneolaceae bacterium]|nr:D-alanyl-D-alanine carboxypeptidase [Balneolaceae bacterium]MCH8548719.1 D-alanyl-D-alanine carboxypeptidase [Balneolaceae bacterium]
MKYIYYHISEKLVNLTGSRWIVWGFVACILPSLAGCGSTETTAQVEAEEILHPLEELFTTSDIFNQTLTGFALYDPEADSMVYQQDFKRFFTPASNTKTLTLYAALKALPDTLPSLRYAVRNDTLYFRGTGDPAFLNPEFESNGVFEFLKNRDEHLVYFDAHYDDAHFGSGWAWDWYAMPYAPEKSPFPIYGNMMRLQAEQVALVILNEDEPVKPRFFERFIDNRGWDGEQLELVTRDHQSNNILYVPKSDTVRQERNIPFIYDTDLFREMLADTLGREIGYANEGTPEFTETLYATPADTLLRRMMLVSDNFVAEQLMLMISEEKTGVLNTEKGIEYSLDNYFGELSDRPRWSDGSGLTRYNLITPRSKIELLEILIDELGEETALSFFPAGGESGTLSGWYRPADGEPPYVYAKTGTLRNNTALSGYVYSRSGKRYSFSFINNNYVISNNAVRSEMGRVLEFIRDNM